MDVSIAGAGYVGLVTGVCLAELGHNVVNVDVDAQKVQQINSGVSPIFEPGLDDLLRRNVGERFRAATDLRDAVLRSDVTLIAVGTPFDGQKIDLQYVEQVARQIGECLIEKDDFHAVVVKSTVVPGTTENVVIPIVAQASGKTPGVDFGVGVNPEFLSEGEAVQDFMQPDRIVIGSNDGRTESLLENLYEPFADTERVKTNLGTAEMIKYASNAVLANLISFSNEIGNLCSALGDIDVTDVMKGVHLAHYFTPRVEGVGRVEAPITAFLGAGCGFGGSCLPKDVSAIVRHGEVAGQPMQLLKAVLDVNEAQPGKMIGLLKKHFSKLDRVTVAVLGLAFKAGTDDIRQSPAIPLIQQLLAENANVIAYDPVVNGKSRDISSDQQIDYAECLEDAVSDADAVLLVTSWQEFERVPDLLALRNPQPVCVDGRRMLRPEALEHYEGIGA